MADDGESDGDRYGDSFVDTRKSVAVYEEWLAMTRPAPGPGNLRRPLWLNRPLHPSPDTLSDVDVLLFDIQDIGTRFYTYQATLGFLMQVAGPLGVKVIVLDRPNPINGVSVEGNVVHEGFESFVGAFPIAIRHAMTVGELSMVRLAETTLRFEPSASEMNSMRRGPPPLQGD